MSKNEPNLFGTDIFGAPIKPDSRGAVADNFLAAPFTVLDARQGWWQDRKRAWINLGIKSEQGRTGKEGKCMPPGGMSLSAQYKAREEAQRSGLIWAPSSSSPGFYDQKRAKEAELGFEISTAEFQEKYYTPENAADIGTSIFDPVVCEIAYRWFAPKGGQVIDPFAGGSVRGIVAQQLGLQYWGSELRPEQVASNQEQAEAICGFDGPTWVCQDALQADPPEGDLLFGCPPYADLEVYSDLPEDLSTMEYPAFFAAYTAIIARFAARLRNNRFAVWVIGEIRNPKTGIYRNFVGDTIAAFQAAGLQYYNEAIIVTMVGSASLRVTRQFNAGRKLCKTHQQCLVFVKGDSKLAAEACAKLD
jgi:hypothetical protein